MRYFAIKLLSSVNGNFVGLSGVMLRKTLADANILTGATATATDEYPGGNNPPSNLIDAFSTNKWLNSGSGFPQRIAFALTKEYYGDYTAFTLFGDPNDSGVSPTDFELQVSDTGDVTNDAAWTTVATINGVVWNTPGANAEQKDFTVALSFPVPPSIEADKLKLAQIQTRLKNGEYIDDDDSIFLISGADTAVTLQIMQKLDAGEGFDGLKSLGFTDTIACRILAIYNVKVDTAKYDSEVALEIIAADVSKLQSFKAYLDTLNISLPPLNIYLNKLRSYPAVFNAAREWAKTLPAQ